MKRLILLVTILAAFAALAAMSGSALAGGTCVATPNADNCQGGSGSQGGGGGGQESLVGLPYIVTSGGSGSQGGGSGGRCLTVFFYPISCVGSVSR
jgi:hypothetical protein